MKIVNITNKKMPESSKSHYKEELTSVSHINSTVDLNGTNQACVSEVFNLNTLHLNFQWWFERK